MLCFDIGSNIGNWSLANINKYEKIIAIEASPKTYKKLIRKCKNKNIIPLNYAVCNIPNEITFYECKVNTLSTINKEWLINKKSRFYNYTKYKKILCKTITIDELIEFYGNPDLIKIDVESGELQCILSLNKKVKLLCFEWAAETTKITFHCINHLLNLGFTKFYIQDGDEYTFRPKEGDYHDINSIKINLLNKIPKVDWGMIWCK